MNNNTILQGDALEKLKELPSKSINMVMTSPPYWALRDYGSTVETIWDEKGKEIGRTKKGKCWNNGEHDWRKNEEIVRFSKNKWKQGDKIIEEKDLHEYRTRRDDFCNKCYAWKGQLGLEPTFDLYIKHLCDIFDEVKRILRNDGTIWVNMGDTYWGGGQGGNDYPGKQVVPSSGYGHKAKGKSYQSKCLVMIPERFAIEMINRGWILRNTIIWHKRNCMPSSVKDRFTVDFEYLFFFSKSKKYYFEQQLELTITKDNIIRDRDTTKLNRTPGRTRMGGLTKNDYDLKNKRTVWSINPQPFGENVCMICGYFDKPRSKQQKKGYFGGEDKSERVCKGCGNSLITSHFAIYPEELCETPIKAGCPKFVCIKCGKPRKAIYRGTSNQAFNIRVRDVKEGRLKHSDRKASNKEIESYKEGETHAGEGKELIGYTDCGCETDCDYCGGIGIDPEDNCNEKVCPYCKGNHFTSGIVLDPFFGAGTTGLVALKQNKKFIGIELNKEYIEIAKKRLKPFLEQTKL